ncbi:MAG TPA: alpha/beta hydrolase, partial [Candidatus Eisenbacteria bacterium]|nr:alpha/beta hydrolase [Candidatus Eisenbacteria bacterium]
LAVPGASLYYEVRGTGPVLLLMPGGPADAATFRRIESRLASQYTVVTYDPRGLSHSSGLDPADDARMVEIFADDVHRLLARSGDGRACVFASSGGAVIALELAARHPEQLDTVVAHEPPSPELLPDTARVRAAMEDVCDTCASAGLWPAIEKFMALVGIQGGPPPAPEGEPSPEALEAAAMMQRNMEFFVGRYIRNIARYQPDMAALKACSCRIVPAVGAESEGQLAHEGGLGLARMLGTEVTVFPGDHGGFDGRAAEFAERLCEVLAAGAGGGRH